jgi:hypothetical protein
METCRGEEDDCIASAILIKKQRFSNYYIGTCQGEDDNCIASAILIKKQGFGVIITLNLS